MITSKKLLKCISSFFMLAVCLGAYESSYAAPGRIAAAGDSITRAFAANCTANTSFFDLFCLIGGDQPENSWFSGNSNSVFSMHDNYRLINSSISATKEASVSGAELVGGANNFVMQASKIISDRNLPDHVEILLGGNDLCNRDCVDPRNCSNPIYSDNTWRNGVRAGLDILVNQLPVGSTVYLGAVPRVQDLRAAGVAKQSSTRRVNCDSIWRTFSVCSIATDSRTRFGETVATRLAGVAAAQKRYNEILRDEAIAYNTNTDNRNPRGIEVISNYSNESTESFGTLVFGKDDIDGGDCFHPSILGQNRVASVMWLRNTDK